MTKKQQIAIRDGLAGSVSAGEIDRGKPDAPFEAASRRANGTILRTRHHTELAALKRLRGNPLHTRRTVTDFTEVKKIRTLTLRDL